jgi:hypothetical protein
VETTPSPTSQPPCVCLYIYSLLTHVIFMWGYLRVNHTYICKTLKNTHEPYICTHTNREKLLVRRGKNMKQMGEGIIYSHLNICKNYIRKLQQMFRQGNFSFMFQGCIKLDIILRQLAVDTLYSSIGIQHVGRCVAVKS